MGYMSEVAYGVKVDDIIWSDKATEEEKNLSADGIFLLMLTEMQSDEMAGKCFDDDLIINKEARTIVFHADSVKWYDDYEDVKCHERLYEIMEEYANLHNDNSSMENPVSCSFTRIGEEIEDIEERGSGYDPWSVMTVSRCIDVHI